MSRAVVTPTGETWRVGRCWLPKQRVRWRGFTTRVRRTSSDPQPRSGGGNWLDALDVFDGENPLAALAFVIGTIVFAALVWFFLVPLLLVLLDITLLVVLTAGRRRPPGPPSPLGDRSGRPERAAHLACGRLAAQPSGRRRRHPTPRPRRHSPDRFARLPAPLTMFDRDGRHPTGGRIS